MKVIALDAALNHTGYAIHNGKRFIDVGMITVDKKLSLPEKLLNICTRVTDLITEHEVERVVLEDCYTAINKKTAYKLSLVHGIIMYAAASHGKTVASIPPARVKKLVVGKGNANKKEVAQAIILLYGKDLKRLNLPLNDLDSDITDALAICHADMIERGCNATQAS